MWHWERWLHIIEGSTIVRAEDVPRGLVALWCIVSNRRALIRCALLGLVVLPTVGTGRADAGYMTSDVLCASSTQLRSEGHAFLSDMASPARLEAAAHSTQDWESEAYPLSSTAQPAAPANNRTGTLIRSGIGNPPPREPSGRQGPSRSDALMQADAHAAHNATGRVPAANNIVCLLHPSTKRLFRPPRQPRS